jgi:hypothetical protein
MFQFNEAILIRPIVQSYGNEEDGDVLLTPRLWCEEVVALRAQVSVMLTLGFQLGQGPKVFCGTFPGLGCQIFHHRSYR